MNIEIKKAHLTDLETLIEWRMTVLREVFSLPSEEPAKQLEDKNRLYYETALPSGEHTACFACCENKIIGCGGICFYQEMPSPDNPDGNCAYLMNIYTSPEFRRLGAGKKIVNWLIQQARQKGIAKIYLETSECGRSLYQELGFDDMTGYMKLKNRITIS